MPIIVLLSGVFITVLLTTAIIILYFDAKKKYGVPKNSNPPKPPRTLSDLVRQYEALSPSDLELIRSTNNLARQIHEIYGLPPYMLSSYPRATYGPTLQDNLQQAIEREDYEEAARLRDLINQTKP